jgi:chromosome segregation ATPase
MFEGWLGYLISAVTGALASGLYIYWQERRNSQTFMMESAGRIDELTRANQSLEHTIHQTREREEGYREEFRLMEREMDKARMQALEYSKQLELRDQHEKVRLEKLNLQKAHLEKELSKHDQKLEGLREEATRWQAEAATMREKVATMESDRVRPLESKCRQLEDELKQQKRLASDLEKRLQGADPEETKKAKRRAAQLNRLYISMKGLREIADERNRNWETALEKLSRHILLAKGRQPAQLQTLSVGPLVGSALDAIGEHLVDDAAIVQQGNLNPPEINA